MLAKNRLVREKERRVLTGVPTSSWYSLIANGLAMPGVRIGRYAVAWPEQELLTLNAARIAGRSDDEVRQLVKRLVAQRSHALDVEAA